MVLTKTTAPDSAQYISGLGKTATGTIILWEVLDRLIGNVDIEEKVGSGNFLQNIRLVEEYLAMVFHRFMENPNPQIKIYINGEDESHRIQPWDLFLKLIKLLSFILMRLFAMAKE